ncbi:MAG: tol-pal system protein YbgF [Rhodospirillales bacterium]|nr:tol-pal system protein YbgF [Rhodospirillales bacterium]
MNSGTDFVNRKFASGVFILAIALSGFMPSYTQGQAWAQSNDLGPLIDRMERLERDIRTLNVILSRGRKPGSQPLVSGAQGGAASSVPNTSIARFEARLSSMEEDIRAATGTVEGVAFDMDQIKQRLEKLVGDVDFRLTTLENAAAGRAIQGRASGAPETSAAPSPGAVTQAGPGGGQPSFASGSGKLGSISQSELDAFRKERGLPKDGDGRAQAGQSAPVQSAAIPGAPKAPPGILPPGTPQEQYRFAFKLLGQAKYDEAEAAWKEFLGKHGDDKLASNAHYWLGKTYYVRKRYKPAAGSFYQGFKTNPKGPKASVTLLELGMSLANLDKKNEACTTFEKLKADFPDASARVLKTVNAEWKRSGCK